ncbi:cingulin [Protopterus annectens]|uniref:cingulin n=1 Tax=Protopterus annectens TaxID=7888 RepID=UPI001CF9D22D|nr:cingulin [Protopterus annectens]XP_043936572.1 cingulin [Protopterus annectens]
MEKGTDGKMAEKQTPLDYGVQIRFINDLSEKGRHKKASNPSSKSSKYGVAVRVQGIGGQPFVVLNSGEKGESYGVKLRSDPSYGTASQGSTAENLEHYNTFPRRKSANRTSSSELPENPYGENFTRQYSRSDSQCSTSDDERGSVHPVKFFDSKDYRVSSGSVLSYKSDDSFSSQSGSHPVSYSKSSGEELRRAHSQDSLLDDTYSHRRYSSKVSNTETPQFSVEVPRSNSTFNLSNTDWPENAEKPKVPSPWSSGGRVSSSSPVAFSQSNKSVSPNKSVLKNGESNEIDTKPLSSVDSLINKFDGRGGQQRGRQPRRNRIPSDDRKRSQSVDGRVESHDASDFRELNTSEMLPQTKISPKAIFSYQSASLGRPFKKSQEPSSRMSNTTRELQSNKLKQEPEIERSSLSKVNAELQFKSTPDLIKDQQELPQADGDDYTKGVIYRILSEGSSESEHSLKRKVNLVFEKIKPFKQAGSSVDNSSLITQNNELEKKVAELQHKLDEEKKNAQNVGSSRDQSSAAFRNLQIQLEEKVEEYSELKEQFDKNKRELINAIQELRQVKVEKENMDTKLGNLENHLSDMQNELFHAQKSQGNSADRDTIEVELLESKVQLQEVELLRQKQDEILHQRERELTALKGALKEEVANHDKEMDRLRLQYQTDMEQLRKNIEQISEKQHTVEAERLKINTVVRNLQNDLDESKEENNHWKELFQKSKEELRSVKQELLQTKVEKEEFEDELLELRDRFSAMQVEVDSVKGSAANSKELETLKKQLGETRKELQNQISEKERQEELLHKKDHELVALKAEWEDEVASCDKEIEQMKKQHQQSLEQLKKDYEETSKGKVAVESEKEAAEQMTKAMEEILKKTQQENEDLKKKVSSLEVHFTEFKDVVDELQNSEKRHKEKLSRLEAERRQMEESLGEAADQEHEAAMTRRVLENKLEEAQRNLSRLSEDYKELQQQFQEEMKQKDQLKKIKNELEEEKRLLDRTIDKLTKELDQMTDESRSSLSLLQSQLEEYKEKSRRDILELQRQNKEKTLELEKTGLTIKRVQEEAYRLKHDLQESLATKETAVLDKDLLTQRIQHLEKDIESKKRTQDDRSKQVKVLEDKVRHLEMELDEEKNTAELMTERANRAREQLDQLRAELMQERAAKQDLECDKISLERQNKDLKSRLTNFEGFQKPNAGTAQLESRVKELESQLQTEEREKNVLLSSNRKLERKVKELSIQIDDERQQVHDQKDQLSLRVKALKRQVDEAEEEIERMEASKKKIQRELEEQHELNEQLQNKVKALEKDVWQKNARSTAVQDDLSSDDDFDSAYDPSSITSLLTESNLKTSSC